MKKVIIVGGGAAGIMSAISASMEGFDVTLIEKNEKLGKKLFITGKGRCNVTNASPMSEFMSKIVRNPRFLYSAFNAFDNKCIMDLLEENGCRLKIERGERVFPVSDHSSDVINTLKKILDKQNVKIIFNTKISDILVREDDGCKIVYGVIDVSGHRYEADSVILATGGASYPATGSDGSSFSIVRKYGHTITELKPALVPFNCSDEWVRQVQGLALKNVEFYLERKGKIVFCEMGEMLFTHFGISGPIVLSASSYYEKKDIAYVDLKPALDFEQLDARLIRDFKENNNRNFSNALDALLPKSLIPVIIELSGIDSYKKVHQVTSNERKKLATLIKKLPLTVIGTRGFEEAIITSGGVSVKEINPKTCESKLVSGLFLCGEMIDVDALTGGYNLQIAWSTGFLAGSSIVAY